MDTQTVINALKTFEAENTTGDEHLLQLIKFYGVKQHNNNEFSVLQSSIVKQLKESKPEVLKFTFGDNVILVSGKTLTDLVALYPETRFDFEYIPPQPAVMGLVDVQYHDGFEYDHYGRNVIKWSIRQEEGIVKQAVDSRIKLSFTDGKVKNTAHLYNMPDGFKFSVREVTLHSESKPEETETSKDKVQAIAVNCVTHVLPNSLRAAMKGEKFVKLSDGIFFETADLRKILKSAILVSFVYNADSSQCVAIATSKHENIFVPSEVSSPTPSTYNPRKKRDEWQVYGNIEFSIYTAYEPVSQETSSFNILSRGAYLADCFFARHPEYDSEKVRQVTAKIVKGMKALVKPNTPKATTREINQFQQMGNIIANSRYQREYAGEVVVYFYGNTICLELDHTAMNHLDKVFPNYAYRALSKSAFTQTGNTFTAKPTEYATLADFNILLERLTQYGFTVAHASEGVLDDNGRYVMAETL